MVWMVTQQFVIKGKRRRLWGGAFLCWVLLMLVTPKIPHSPNHHQYADMRNFLGVPNTLNVITNFPFLVVGVLGFVLCVQGGFFSISLPGEVWGWALFYAGIAGLAFGSAYYHLKPDDSRVTWDSLPTMIAFSSLFSSFIVERVGERIGLSCLFALLFIAFLSTAYERTYNDIRLYMMFQLIPCIAIPGMIFVFPPKYTHSRYWFWAAGKSVHYQWALFGAPVFSSRPCSAQYYACAQKQEMSKAPLKNVPEVGKAKMVAFLSLLLGLCLNVSVIGESFELKRE